MADKKNTGSPAGEPLYLSVGFLRRPHGVKGEIVMDLHTDFPERMKSGRKLFVGEAHQPVTLTNVRPHQAGLLVKFKGIETPEEALPEGKIYKHELIGFHVVDDNDNLLGELVEILETGANDVYVVREDSGKEILLPDIPSVILDLEPASRTMRVHLLDGLVSG